MFGSKRPEVPPSPKLDTVEDLVRDMHTRYADVDISALVSAVNLVTRLKIVDLQEVIETSGPNPIARAMIGYYARMTNAINPVAGEVQKIQEEMNEVLAGPMRLVTED